MVSGAGLVLTRANRERFCKFVIKPLSSDGCWIWGGYKDKNGYGRFALPKKQNIQAHRMAYLMWCGRLEEGLEVCHKCDNPSCVRPSHLFQASHKENMADRNRKGRVASGERNGRWKGGATGNGGGRFCMRMLIKGVMEDRDTADVTVSLSDLLIVIADAMEFRSKDDYTREAVVNVLGPIIDFQAFDEMSPQEALRLVAEMKTKEEIATFVYSFCEYFEDMPEIPAPSWANRPRAAGAVKLAGFLESAAHYFTRAVS